MSKRVLFMGTPEYADAILKTLLDASDIEVVAVFTQPDKPVGRKQILTPPPVKITALAHHVPLFQPASLKKEDFATPIRALNPDFIVVAAYGQILPQSILDIAPSINLHASILPHYRGASPIQQALLAGDKKTGVTAMLMDAGMDTGDILAIHEIPVLPELRAPELFDALTKVACDLTLEVLRCFDQLKPVKQDDAKASYCTKISKEQGLVRFDDALEIVRCYRAFTPWPGIYLESGLKLINIALASAHGKHRAGEILAVDDRKITVGCEEGSLDIYTVQPPSRKEMDVKSYMNGQRLKVADILV